MCRTKAVIFALTCLSVFISLGVRASEEGMPSLAVLKPKSTYTISLGQEKEVSENQGFGLAAPRVKMMNLMMVEGSGLAGMDMNLMKHPSSERKSEVEVNDAGRAPPYVIELLSGANTQNVGIAKIRVKIENSDNHEPAANLNLSAEVSMTTMDMGTETVAVHELHQGEYEFKAPFSMPGTWRVKMIFPHQFQKNLDFEIKK